MNWPTGLLILLLQIFGSYSHLCSAEDLKGSNWKNLLKEIEEQANILVTDSTYEDRLRAFELLQTTIPTFLKEHQRHIDKLKEVEGVITLEHKDIVISTFQLNVDIHSALYGGFILRRDVDRVYTLHDRSEYQSDSEFDRLTPVEWYGALYYGLHPLDDKTFLLFGYDSYSFFDKRKLIEVLCLEGEEILFGKAIIENPKAPVPKSLHRFFLEYSVQAPPILRFDESLQSIVFDHLQPVIGQFEDQPVMMVPDGTYSGFSIEEPIYLKYLDQVYDGRRAEPHLEQPGRRN